SPFVPGSDVSYALENLIEGSPQTLFVVAAGNEYSEMSYKGYCALPVCLPYSNMLRVGALNVAGYSKSELENSSRADFSNYGTETVDIFAPGELVVAAGIGNQQVAFSGTSMASPNALNIILKMKEISETQNIQTLKEILMKSAYIENISSPMPCKSGGKIFPERAYAVLRQLSKSPHLSIEESVLLVRKQGLLLKGEDHSPKTIEKLREIWSKF
ncbi:MAG: S8 family serine peptidase, partial [Pseudobdellovibrionaceae bacterium]